MAKKETKEKDSHKGTFVGVHLSDEQIEKVELIAQAFNDAFGDVGRNRARALRWLIDSFDASWLNNFPNKPVMATNPPSMPAKSHLRPNALHAIPELPTPTLEQMQSEAERRAKLKEQMDTILASKENNHA